MIWKVLSERTGTKPSIFIRIVNEAPLRKDRERAFQEILKLPGLPAAEGTLALCCLVNTGFDKAYKEKAWKALIERSPVNAIFCKIIKHATGSYPEAAWMMLKSKELSLEEIKDLLEGAPEKYRAKVSEWVLNSASFKDNHKALCLVIQLAPQNYKLKAWKRLQEAPTEGDLRDLILNAPEGYKAAAWDKLIEQEPGNAILEWLAHNCSGTYKEKAKEILKERGEKKELITALPTERLVELLLTPIRSS
ncbi:hypothetical protein KJA16_00705 [Patescibacteria group bacterium]|nr:hypothetical protein [Patescibacteria group bacterium]